MGKTLMAYAFVRDELFKADTAVVRTAAASALVNMNRNKNFTSALKQEFANTYKNAIMLGDLGVTSVVCDALSDPELDYKATIKDIQFLADVKARLRLPADHETLQAVDGALAYFQGKEPDPVRNDFNHPIDWSLVSTIKSDQHAVIATSKGIITIALLVDEAPGSVANFVALVRAGAYHDKYFHRVVPNFVAQGGCPRGDGFGSEDYSIRSEFSVRRYKTGSVGLASSGKDTESCQWFITHSPTPHLDGAYTIFAEVVEGMDIVHQLEVGDKILNIELP
jgi:cyclophilin family peptidyl-prolyl cis-trans isomerase